MQKRLNEINETFSVRAVPKEEHFHCFPHFPDDYSVRSVSMTHLKFTLSEDEGEGRKGEVSKVPTAANIHRDQLLSGQRHDFSAVLTGNSRSGFVHV